MFALEVEIAGLDRALVDLAAEVLNHGVRDVIEVLAEVLLVGADGGEFAVFDLAEFDLVDGARGDGLLQIAADVAGDVLASVGLSDGGFHVRGVVRLWTYG